MCLLAQINPLKPPTRHGRDDDEIRTVQLHHAHQVCGIVAHTKDHGVASVAIRSIAIAGTVLTEPREQYEVLDVLKRVYHHTGWNLKRVESELKRAWGWEPPETVGAGGSSGSAAGLPPPGQTQLPIVPSSQGGTLGAAAVMSQLFGSRDPSTNAQPESDNRRFSQPPGPAAPVPLAAEPRRASVLHNSSNGLMLTQPLFSASTTGSGRHNSITRATPSNHASPSATTHTPASISSTLGNAATPPNRPMVNPLLAQADFTQPNHPYREWYKPPDRTASANSNTFGGGGLWPY